MKKLVLTLCTLPVLISIAWLLAPFVFTFVYRPSGELSPELAAEAATYKLFCQPYAIAMAVLIYAAWGMVARRSGGWRNEFFDRSSEPEDEQPSFLGGLGFYILDIMVRFLVGPLLLAMLIAAAYWSYTLFTDVGSSIPGLLGIPDDAPLHEQALQTTTLITAGCLLFSRTVLGYLRKSSN